MLSKSIMYGLREKTQTDPLDHHPTELALVSRVLSIKRRTNDHIGNLPELKHGVLLADRFVQQQPIAHTLVSTDQEGGATVEVLGVHDLSVLELVHAPLQVRFGRVRRLRPLESTATTTLTLRRTPLYMTPVFLSFPRAPVTL